MSLIPNLRDISIRLLDPIGHFEDKMIAQKQDAIKGLEQDFKGKTTEFILIGDSHTYFLKQYIDISESITINIALNGETTRGLLNRIDKNISNINFNNAVIQVGYNDFKYRSFDQILKNYKQILSNLKGNVYIVSLFPVDGNRSIINSNIQLFNSELKKLCDASSGNYTFVDVFSKLYNIDAKGIFKTLTIDGTHLNKDGYGIYLNELNKILNIDNLIL